MPAANEANSGSGFSAIKEVCMSSVKSSHDEACPACSPCTSGMRLTSIGGATMTRSASSTPSCTSTSSATLPSSGNKTIASPATPEGPRLLEIVTAPGYADRVSAAVERVAVSQDPAAAQLCLAECIAALGVESAFFVHLVRDGDDLFSCRFMLACDPGWFQRRLDGCDLTRDPWLAYATHHAEPILASDPALRGTIDPAAHDTTLADDFASAFLIPAQSGPGHSHAGLLVLGSAQTGFFEGEGLGRLRLSARALAAELHDWWLARRRLELLARTRLTPIELELLRHERLGHGSKQIARFLRSSEGAVNSRFQRLNHKLGTPNRRAAARLAVECRLLPF